MSSDRGGSERGFAAMDEEERRKIAQKGGEASGEARSETGRKGGQPSESGGEQGFAAMDEEERRKIAQKGGQASAESRDRGDSGSRGGNR
jgi:uncharacterized protein